MKISLIILLSTIINYASFGQKHFKAVFYPTSIIVNGVLQQNDTISTRLNANKKSRVVLWEDEQNKFSILYKIKSSKRKIITKARTEIFTNGKWQKAKLKIRFIERRFLKISRWTSSSRSTGLNKSITTKQKTSVRINRIFTSNDGKKIEIIGYFELTLN